MMTMTSGILYVIRVVTAQFFLHGKTPLRVHTIGFRVVGEAGHLFLPYHHRGCMSDSQSRPLGTL